MAAFPCTKSTIVGIVFFGRYVMFRMRNLKIYAFFSDPFQPTSMKLSTPNLFSCPLCCSQQIAAILWGWGGSLPANHPKAGPPFPKNNKRIGMVSLMRTYMFGRCLKLYFPEKKSMLKLKLNTYPRASIPEIIQKCVFTNKIIWHPKFCLMSWSTPPKPCWLVGNLPAWPWVLLQL